LGKEFANLTHIMSEVNPVLKLFKWEDYTDGYMITFWPRSTFERYEDIVNRVADVWHDDFEIDMPAGERVDLVQPEDVAIWKGTKPEFVKKETEDNLGFHYSDVLQGPLGDCWFMSALSGIAIAGRLSEVVSQFDDQKGIYEFRMQRWDSKTRAFSPIYVCVDRRVPVARGSNTPAFCYSETAGELWPSLLEKAFAKAIRVWKAHPSAERGGKGFGSMDGGLSALGVAHLLGGESGCYWVKEGTRWDQQSSNNLAQLFADLFEKGVFINVNFKETSSKVVGPKGETRGHQGLVAGHSYSILRLEFFNIRGTIFRLLQLRNPWGKTQGGHGLEWSADWSAESSLWRKWPEAADICLGEGKPDGVFWMSIEDLSENMDAFEICDAPQWDTGLLGTGVLKKGWLLSKSKTGRQNSRRDEHLRRQMQRAEYERRKLEQELQAEREQRLKLEAKVDILQNPPPKKGRAGVVRGRRPVRPLPGAAEAEEITIAAAEEPVRVVETADEVVIQQPSPRRPSPRGVRNAAAGTLAEARALEAEIDALEVPGTIVTPVTRDVLTTVPSSATRLSVGGSVPGSYTRANYLSMVQPSTRTYVTNEVVGERIYYSQSVSDGGSQVRRGSATVSYVDRGPVPRYTSVVRSASRGREPVYVQDAAYAERPYATREYVVGAGASIDRLSRPSYVTEEL
jgi:hypothetical protein